MTNRKIGTTSLGLKSLIIDLKKLSTKEKVSMWKRISNDLNMSKRKRREVNLNKIDKYTREGEVALVPGKVLSEGQLTKKITVAGYKFSEKAKQKINKIGRAISIKELTKENPKGKKVRIIG